MSLFASFFLSASFYLIFFFLIVCIYLYTFLNFDVEK